MRNTVPSCRWIFICQGECSAEYETIDEADLKDDDVVVERIHEEAKTEEKENENGEKEVVEISPAKDKVKINKRPVSLSDTNPLWMKHPNECTDEEYKAFYRKVFMDYKEPLFWIHLNMDYPFNLKGILYFPKINTEYDSIEGTIKLYNNQVFIADNIKEVIPEFLLLLKGVIDCPDLPLNVSVLRCRMTVYCRRFRIHCQENGRQAFRHVQNRQGIL